MYDVMFMKIMLNNENMQIFIVFFQNILIY